MGLTGLKVLVLCTIVGVRLRVMALGIWIRAQGSGLRIKVQG